MARTYPWHIYVLCNGRRIRRYSLYDSWMHRRHILLYYMRKRAKNDDLPPRVAAAPRRIAKDRTERKRFRDKGLKHRICHQSIFDKGRRKSAAMHEGAA